ncbi:hypothetical protein [Pararhodonellum marinum]|uniref:hypothetical protein n=1 Tax=Pararhodonellum marinum TaxID=2755358 RepID=UPI00293BDE67|nr:hypothetical protein [Pararhodonellum marinum]
MENRHNEDEVRINRASEHEDRNDRSSEHDENQDRNIVDSEYDENEGYKNSGSDRYEYDNEIHNDRDSELSEKEVRQNIASAHNENEGQLNRTSEDQNDWATDQQGHEVRNESTSEKRVLSGMFRDRESAERAYNTLSERGYSKDEINLVMSKETREKDYNENAAEETEIGTKAAEHAGKGSAIGGSIGAVVGVIAAIGTSVAIPGLGILIAGPVAAGLAGAGAGGLAGGLIGALVGSGIPEARAKLYESGIKEGNVVITVTPKNTEDAKYLEENWRDNRGEEVHW